MTTEAPARGDGGPLAGRPAGAVDPGACRSRGDDHRRRGAARKADEARGTGEGERNRIFAEAFNRDPEFFAFYRSMQAYEAGLKAGDTRMVLSPDSPFFRYFNNPLGTAGKSDRAR